MDPEQIYQEVLQEEQQKGSSGPVAEGRAKAARVRAEQGSPHPKEPKWWPGAQPHLEGAEAPAAEEAAEEVPAEPAAEEVAPEPVAAAPTPAEPPPEPSEQAAAQATEQPAPTAATQPGGAAPPPSPGIERPAAAGAPPAQPAAAEQPAAAAAAVAAPQPETAPAPAMSPTRPAGVTHGTTTGTRLRPEDETATEAQFEGQRAMYERRKLIDELVSTGVPAVAAEDTGVRRPGSPFLSLLYVLIPLAAIFILYQQVDEAPAGGGEAPAEPAGNGALTVTAESTAFDTDTIELTAGEEQTIEFHNEDAASLQHNIAIYESQGGDELFKGEIIPGGSSAEYTIPPLEPGEYYFQCDVHPAMSGAVAVT